MWASLVDDLEEKTKLQAARIKAMEASLRWIVKSCDVKIHRMSLFDEIREEARSALED